MPATLKTRRKGPPHHHRLPIRPLLAGSTSSVWPGLNQSRGNGLPTVATAVGGVPELISDGDSGRLVPANDADALAKAIIEVAESDTVRYAIGESAQETITNDFSIGAQTGKLHDVYAEVLRWGLHSTLRLRHAL